MPATAINASNDHGFASVIGRHPDIVVMVLAFPVFVLAELSLAAYALAVGVWFAQSLIVGWMNSKASAADDPKTIIGMTIGGFIARAWIAAAGLVVAALAFDDRAGLSVALLLIALFTVYFAHRIVTHSAPGGIA